MIDRHVEETLDLGGVQVHGQHAIGAGFGDQVCHEFGRDRDTPSVFAVLTGISKIGDDGRNSFRARSLAGVNDRQQLHQIIVHGRSGWLDQEDITTPNVMVQPNADFPVRKIAQLDGAQ